MSDLPQKLLEEKLRKARLAKMKFKAAIRDVIYNISWIADDDTSATDEVKGGAVLTIKQTLSCITRRKKTTERLEGKVTITEKALLRKNIKYRTDEDKNRLNKSIGGLKCFRSYPEAVQSELVAVTYFEYYGPGRVLIRQNDEGYAMYFILKGEVIVYKTMLDEMSNTYEEVEVNRLHKGDTFGEIALLHGVRRTATCVTAAPCELLVLKKNDFDQILKANLTELWDQIKSAMSNLVYFKDWDKILVTECCILARLETFGRDEVIFGDKPVVKGMSPYTYFIIEGSCSVVEHLFIEEYVEKGIKCYKLHDIPDYNNYSEIASGNDSLLSTITVEDLDRKIELIAVRTEKMLFELDKTRSLRLSGLSTTSEVQDLPTNVSNVIRQSLTAFDVQELEGSFLKKTASKNEKRLPQNVKVVFMQICTFSEKATFVDNDLMKNRRVIALTPCKILCIPTYYLIQHNRANVWTRVEFFLQTKLPTTKEVYEKYVNLKKWHDYKSKVLSQLAPMKKTYNSTSIHDVPYTIRTHYY